VAGDVSPWRSGDSRLQLPAAAGATTLEHSMSSHTPQQERLCPLTVPQVIEAIQGLPFPEKVEFFAFTTDFIVNHGAPLTRKQLLIAQRRAVEAENAAGITYFEQGFDPYQAYVDVVLRHQRGPKSRNARAERRNQLIDQYVIAGANPKDAQAIFEFIKSTDASLLFRKSNQSKAGLISPASMMKAYSRSKHRRG
jgi:hypothetical protein